MAINGNAILIKMNGTAIAATKSCEVQTDTEFIEISDPDDGEWVHVLKGRRKWSLTVNYLLGTESDFTKVLLNGSSCSIIFTDRSGNVLLTGSAYVGTVRHTATIGNLAQGSFQFVGNGELAEPEPEPSQE